jgi:tRNA U38,U39,U40 pseudouridine synthase TruA
MVGTAVYFARGNIPLSVIDAALILPLHIPLPMAPAEGLLLVDSGYMFNLNQVEKISFTLDFASE